MKNIKKIFTYFMVMNFPIITFAMTCPTNFSIIKSGDTPENIISQCGQPTEIKESTRPNENFPQEWNYYIPQTVGMYGSIQQAQGTLKTTITFDSNGKAINMTVNGIGVGASTICGSPVQLGATRDQIRGVCGDPAFINKVGSGGTIGSSNQPTDIKIIEFNYANTNPPQKLIFEDGRLLEK